MLNIIVVEDEPLFAETLRHLIELNPRYIVTDVAEDYASALAAAGRRRPDLALVDLQLAHGSTGFSVAAKFAEMAIPCLFTSGKAPSFPIPDLALGCLVKPFSEEDLVRALKAAEDILRGRERLRPSRPGNLRLYAEEQARVAATASSAPPPHAADERSSIKARLSGWWSGGGAAPAEPLHAGASGLKVRSNAKALLAGKPSGSRSGVHRRTAAIAASAIRPA